MRMYMCIDMCADTCIDLYTAIRVAALGGHAEVIKVLLDAKAPADTADDLGFSPAWIAKTHGHTQVVELLLLSRVMPPFMLPSGP